MRVSMRVSRQMEANVVVAGKAAKDGSKSLHSLDKFASTYIYP